MRPLTYLACRLNADVMSRVAAVLAISAVRFSAAAMAFSRTPFSSLRNWSRTALRSALTDSRIIVAPPRRTASPARGQPRAPRRWLARPGAWFHGKRSCDRHPDHSADLVGHADRQV